MMVFPGIMAPTYLIPTPVAICCPALPVQALERKEEKKEEKKPDPPKPDPPKPDPPKHDTPKPPCKPKCIPHEHSHHCGPHVQINYGHNVQASTICCCGGCSVTCCGTTSTCKAPKNESSQTMYWLDKKNGVHGVKHGDLIPHYSKIIQVYLDREKKWTPFNPTSDMKKAQDACFCVAP